MSWLAPLTKLLEPIGDALFGWIKRRHERKMARHEAELQIIKTHTDYDTMAQSQRQNTWLDELFGCWVLAMMTYAMFDDAGMDRIARFKDLPEFIQITFMLIIGSLFGWRTIIGPMVSKRTGTKMLGVGDVSSKKDDRRG